MLEEKLQKEQTEIDPLEIWLQNEEGLNALSQLPEAKTDSLTMSPQLKALLDLVTPEMRAAYEKFIRGDYSAFDSVPLIDWGKLNNLDEVQPDTAVGGGEEALDEKSEG